MTEAHLAVITCAGCRSDYLAARRSAAAIDRPVRFDFVDIPPPAADKMNTKATPVANKPRVDAKAAQIVIEAHRIEINKRNANLNLIFAYDRHFAGFLF
jgi:hypothetical protein